LEIGWKAVLKRKLKVSGFNKKKLMILVAETGFEPMTFGL
jgi:hypothetical protein